MTVGSDPPGPARRGFIGLGSNLGDRWHELSHALGALASAGDVTAVSPVYETGPIGGPADQPPYLNAVVELCTVSTPRQLLLRCRSLEASAGRVRTIRFGPRTLDADVLLVGDLVVDDPDLVVPHPRMWERRFVLVPLSDLAPELVPAGAISSAVGSVRRVGTLGAHSSRSL